MTINYTAEIVDYRPEANTMLVRYRRESYPDELVRFAAPQIEEAVHVAQNSPPLDRWEAFDKAQEIDASSLLGLGPQSGVFTPPSPPTVEEQQAVLQQSIVNATQSRLDAFAQTKNYDGILSAISYATSDNPDFAAEGQRAATLRDSTWATLYQMLAEVQTGARPIPAGFEDIEAELPELTWEAPE